MAAAATYFYLHSRPPVKLTDKDTIVLADFTNTTGDAVFDDTLKQPLRVQLEQLSVCTHVMARGNDVTFVKNTPMEIRFGTHESSSPAEADPKEVPSEKPGVAKL
jgi:hypothetical protein